MEKLRELFETKIKILSEKKTKEGDTMNILAPWIVTGRMNKNKRLYPLALIQREIARVQAKIKAGAMISSADHPAVHTSLADASHIIRKLEIDKDGKGWMEATILPTTKGRNVMTIIKAGGQLGISARGAGTVNSSGTVEKDYALLGIDFCTSPSEPEAVFNKSNVCESVEFEEENPEDKKMQLIAEHHRKAEREAEENIEEDLMMGLTEKYVEGMIESIYGMQIDDEPQTFEGSLEDFKKKKGNLVRAEILVAHDHFETTEEALIHLGAHEEAKRISAAPVQRKVTQADVYYEAQMMGVDPKTYAEKLNASLEEKVEPDFTVQEVASILEEARISGIDISDPEERKRILDLAREEKKQRILTEDEKAEIVAERTGATPKFVKEIWALERKKKEKEKKKSDEIQSRIREEDQSGFGSEIRPDARKISKKILEGE